MSELVATAWASASTFRGGDKRRRKLARVSAWRRRRDWAVNRPDQLAKVLKALERIQMEFNLEAAGGKKVSLADLIVLAGGVGVEQAARRAASTSRCRSVPAALMHARTRPDKMMHWYDNRFMYAGKNADYFRGITKSTARYSDRAKKIILRELIL